MKVYALGFLDGDGQGLAVWECDNLYSTLEKAQEELLKA